MRMYPILVFPPGVFMFDLLPDAFSKVSVRKALGATVGLSACAGVCIGQFLIFAVRLHPSIFEYLNVSLLTLLTAGLAVRYYLLALSRIDELELTTTAQE
jgi:hypothetical protein